MRFPEFVLKNVLRRKFRTALTTIGVAVSIAAVIALLSITRGYARSSKAALSMRGVDMVVSRAGAAQLAASSIDEDVAEKIKQIPGVEAVTKSLHEDMPLDGQLELGKYRVDGWPADSFAFNSLTILEGRKLKPDDKDGIMLGVAVARDLNKKVGDVVQFNRAPHQVVGIHQTGNLIDDRGAIVLLSVMQELMEREGQVNTLQIALDKNLPNREAELKRVRDAIEGLRSEEGSKYGLIALPTQEFVESDNQVRIAGAMAWVTSAIALIVGAIGMLNTMIVSVLERTQEIGILRAIGWRKVRVMRMILAEAFTLSILGAIAGTALAAILIRVLTQFPVARRFGSGELTPDILLIGLAMSLLVGLVGGAYPALRGASLPPTEALRYE